MIHQVIQQLEEKGRTIPAPVKETFISREATIDKMNLSNIANDACKRANVNMMLVQIDLYEKYGHMVF